MSEEKKKCVISLIDSSDSASLSTDFFLQKHESSRQFFLEQLRLCNRLRKKYLEGIV